MCFGINPVSVGAICCQGFCAAGSASKRLMKKDVKVGYGILAVFFCLALALVMFVLSDWFSFLASWVGCGELKGNDQVTCIATYSAFR
jgi:hypothetical protein